ncbi:gamma-aminobutyric acid type B receptor subunit 2-like [Antedon mediterranea]|uniref:gamma-aminobutyric acid type B receptor subunit 2-like n=1 Tax=Antedon mediterranea TaxID=105859 RepID=UPI003AF5C27F
MESTIWIWLLICGFVPCFIPNGVLAITEHFDNTYCGTKGMVTNMKRIYIGGLFPLKGNRFHSVRGRSELEAARYALDLVNEQSSSDGFVLCMFHNDTECDTGIGADALFDQFYRKPPMKILLGCSCSEVSKHVATITQYWNVVMLSYASTSVALSKRELYPTFFRTVSPDTSQGSALGALLVHFNWTTVASLTYDIEFYSLAAREIINLIESTGVVEFATKASFVDDPGAELDKIKEQDRRIIIGTFGQKEARKVFCEAYRRGMHKSKYVWLLIGWYSKEWWRETDNIECTQQELMQATNNVFFIDSLNLGIEDKPSVSGLKPSEFETLFSNGSTRPISPHAPQTFDAIWTIYQTLRNTITVLGRNLSLSQEDTIDLLSKLNYKNNRQVRHILMQEMAKQSFDGVSGTVRFDGPDRLGTTRIRQKQGDGLATVALFFPEDGGYLDFTYPGCSPIKWPGRIPVDELTYVEKPLHVSSSALIVISVINGVGISVALAFLGFNIRFRNDKSIKMSSPNLNNCIVVGCILVYLSVILQGLHTEIVPVSSFVPLCTARAMLLASGFSLAFGSMFVKTYRVYHIVTHATSRGLGKRIMLRESILFAMVGGLLALDLIVFILWATLDPMYRQVTKTQSQVSEDETIAYIFTVESCSSNRAQIWLGVVYTYKGLLLLFGVFLAWETRKVKIPALNDSNYIALSVYNVVMLSVIAVAVSSLVKQPHLVTITFTLVTGCVVTMATATLALLFIPKVISVRSNHLGGDPISSSVGLETRGQTRRLIADESTELKENIYRWEVQNRAYKKECEKLEQKIAELEAKLLSLQNSEKINLRENRLSTIISESSDTSELLIDLPETIIDNYNGSPKTESPETCPLLERGDSGRHSIDSRQAPKENIYSLFCVQAKEKTSTNFCVNNTHVEIIYAADEEGDVSGSNDTKSTQCDCKTFDTKLIFSLHKNKNYYSKLQNSASPTLQTDKQKEEITELPSDMTDNDECILPEDTSEMEEELHKERKDLECKLVDLEETLLSS